PDWLLCVTCRTTCSFDPLGPRFAEPCLRLRKLALKTTLVSSLTATATLELHERLTYCRQCVIRLPLLCFDLGDALAGACPLLVKHRELLGCRRCPLGHDGQV